MNPRLELKTCDEAGAEMTTIARPNKNALIEVIDIYRDAMRNYPQGAGEPAYLARLKAC